MRQMTEGGTRGIAEVWEGGQLSNKYVFCCGVITRLYILGGRNKFINIQNE